MPVGLQSDTIDAQENANCSLEVEHLRNRGKPLFIIW